MTTNLIFKKSVVVNNIATVVTRIVPVDIPTIEAGSGWILSGHADIVEVPSSDVVTVMNSGVESLKELSIEPPVVETEKEQPVVGSKFESSVSGTAKLVRSKGVIKIVARRGKSTFNSTTPNSVCINDFTKNEFFKSCRERHGQSAGIFEFRNSDGTYYDYWNDVIDKEYQRQLKEYKKKLEG